MLERLMERGKTSGRADDNAESIKKRFRECFALNGRLANDYEQGAVLTLCCHWLLRYF